MSVQNSKIKIQNSKLKSSEIFNFKFLILNSRRGGFTLIETIIVMVIAVILAAVVAVRWSPFDTIKLNSATRKVAADIRYSQKVAISTQQISGVVFSGTTYTVFASETSMPVRSPGDPCSDSGGNFIVDFSADRCSNFNGATVSTITLYFNSLGTPVNAFGSIITDAEQAVIVTYNGTQQITIWRSTGRVSY
jgi:prepilin-type N-terminal cleavage/methylation domain-containing protein